VANKQARPKHEQITRRSAGGVRVPDFHLSVADDAEPLQLYLNREDSLRVNEAVHVLLSRLPDVALEENDTGISTAFREPEQLETLPVPVSQFPALSGFPAICWRKMKQLPGYRMSPIRHLGNAIFKSFPCFEAFAVEAKTRKLDALGETLSLSMFTHDKSVVDRVARTIVENGVLLNAGEMNFDEILPGYRPRVALFMNEKSTFLLVQEKRENGAPVDANCIYAWPGGRQFYEPRIAADTKKEIAAPKSQKRKIKTIIKPA